MQRLPAAAARRHPRQQPGGGPARAVARGYYRLSAFGFRLWAPGLTALGSRPLGSGLWALGSRLSALGTIVRRAGLAAPSHRRPATMPGLLREPGLRDHRPRTT